MPQSAVHWRCLQKVGVKIAINTPTYGWCYRMDEGDSGEAFVLSPSHLRPCISCLIRLSSAPFVSVLAPLSFRLQKFTLRPSNWPGVHHSTVFCTEQSRECLPYTTAPFSVPHVSASGPRTGEAPFLYRTENRLKVIEL